MTPPSSQPRTAGRAVFAWALAATIAMFPLIWMGGLVTSHGVGMSVPDWPNTFGYNMWAVPWGHWVGGDAGGVFYEHFHRLLGTVAGFAAVGCVLAACGASHRPFARRCWGVAAIVGLALVVVGFAIVGGRSGGHVGSLGGALALTATVAWLTRNPPESRPWALLLSFALLAAIIGQGVLGGLRVVFDSVDLAMVHGITGQLTLCVGGLTALAASPWWHNVERQHRPAVAWPAIILLGLCVIQLVVAVAMRHNGAGLAVPDWPLHYGQVVPPVNDAALAVTNAERRFELHLPAVSLAQVWLHVGHRLGAYLILGVTVWVVWRLWHVARKHAAFVGGLVLVQATLGVLTVLLGKPADLATLHVATGALLLLTVALLAARLGRQYGVRPALAPATSTPTPAASPSPYALT